MIIRTWFPGFKNIVFLRTEPLRKHKLLCPLRPTSHSKQNPREKKIRREITEACWPPSTGYWPAGRPARTDPAQTLPAAEHGLLLQRPAGRPARTTTEACRTPSTDSAGRPARTLPAAQHGLTRHKLCRPPSTDYWPAGRPARTTTGACRPPSTDSTGR